MFLRTALLGRHVFRGTGVERHQRTRSCVDSRQILRRPIQVEDYICLPGLRRCRRRVPHKHHLM
jgi:hypothetical protein